VRNARCKGDCWIKERVQKAGDAECWRYGVDEKHVAKAGVTTEKVSCKDNLAKQP